MRGWLQDTFVPQEYADQLQLAASPTQVSIRNLGRRTAWGLLAERADADPVQHRGRRPPRREPDGESASRAALSDQGAPRDRHLRGRGEPVARSARPVQDIPSDITLNYSAGTGLRLQTPIGPIAVDYGINLSRLFSSARQPAPQLRGLRSLSTSPSGSSEHRVDDPTLLSSTSPLHPCVRMLCFRAAGARRAQRSERPTTALAAVAFVHGGAGPWAVAGYRMGQAALARLGLSRQSFDLDGGSPHAPGGAVLVHRRRRRPLPPAPAWAS
jgi:hypothetical protein